MKRSLLLLLTLSLFGCLDEIDLPINRGFTTSFVFQGKLIKGNPSKIELYVDRLFDFTAEGRSVPPRMTLVVLRNTKDQEIELKFISNGLYEAVLPNDPNSFEVDYNIGYQMFIQDVNGNTFESEFESIIPNPGVTNIEAERIEKSTLFNDGTVRTAEFMSYRINAPTVVPGYEEKSRFLWRIEPTYQLTDRARNEFGLPAAKTCWIPRTVALFSPKIYDGNAFEANEIEQFTLVDDGVNHVYAEGLYFNVFQESLSAGAYQYWEEVKTSVEQTGDIFSATTGKLNTNFKSMTGEEIEVFGFFYATEIDTFRKFISSQMAGFPDSLCYFPEYEEVTVDEEPRLCTNCLEETRSDTVRPPYWIE